jgi:hypothetical protein
MDHYETGLTGRLWEERRVADEACCSERLPHLSWPDRIEHYHHTTGNPQSLFMGGDGRVAGIFIMGNDYRVKSEYHGGYPATYLKRIKALFPDKRRVLHLFSGRVDLDLFPGDTVDINPGLNPTYLDDEVRHHNGQAEHRRGQSRTPGAWHSRCVAGPDAADVSERHLRRRGAYRHGQVNQPPVPSHHYFPAPRRGAHINARND